MKASLRAVGPTLRRLFAPAMLILALMIATLMLAAMIVSAGAQEIRPAVVSDDPDADGGVELRIVLNLKAYVAGVAPSHSDTSAAPEAAACDQLRAAPPETLAVTFAPLAGDIAARLLLSFDGAPIALRFDSVEISEVADLALARRSTLNFSGAAAPGAAATT